MPSRHAGVTAAPTRPLRTRRRRTALARRHETARLPGTSRRRVPYSRRAIDTTLVVPAYNEAAGLRVLLPKIFRAIDRRTEVIVVDDGSGDGTAAVARGLGAKVIRHDVNQGKGAALRTALAAAAGRRVVVIDADDTYPVDAIPQVVAALDRFAFVVGVRRTGRMYISPFNRLGNEVFRRAIALIAGRHVSDPLTGLYGLDLGLARRMLLSSSGFGIEAEINIKAGRLDASMLEIPIDYRPRIGESKLSPVRDGIVILRTILSLMTMRARHAADEPRRTSTGYRLGPRVAVPVAFDDDA